MAQRQVRRIRRTARMLREERLEREKQEARVGVRTGWRWALLRPCLPALRWVLPERWLVAIANRAARHFRWRVDQGDWRPYDPPRHFEVGEL